MLAYGIWMFNIRSCDLAPTPASSICCTFSWQKLVKWQPYNYSVHLIMVSSLHAAPGKYIILLLPLPFSTSSFSSSFQHFLVQSLQVVISQYYCYVFSWVFYSSSVIHLLPCFYICIKKILSIYFFLTWGMLCAILSSLYSGNPPSFSPITALETWLVYQLSNHTHFKIHFFFFLPIRYWEMVDCNFSKLQELV